MKLITLVLVVLFLTGVFAFSAGCSSAPAAPSVAITSPQNMAALTGSSIPVTVSVSNFNVVDKQGQASVAGEGHIHFYMDVSPIPSDPTKPAIPADASAAWAHVSGTSYTFTNVTPGSHTITVQLVNNDHTPVSPLVTASVMVMVSQQGGTPSVSIISPQNGAALTGSSIPVSVSVSNFNVVDKQGQASAAGEGHIHFYMDVSPIPSDPTKPAIPADAKAIWAHVSGTSYTFTNVTPGSHTITVQLANNDHTPVIPLATSTVTVTVAGGAPSTPDTTAAAGATTQVTLTAQNIAFDKSTITVPHGSQVVMTFKNMDSGVVHNFALYTDSSARNRIFAGDFVTGVKTVTYTFTAPSAPGTYYFRCDVHPTVMYGSFVVT